MKLGRSACLAAIVSLGAWSLAACSSDNTTNNNPEGGTGETGGTGGGGTGGKGGSSGSSGSAGKSGGGGTAGTAGSAGSSGKAGSAGSGGAGTGGATMSTDGGFDGGEPGVKITAPADKTMVGPGAMYPDYPDVPISFTVSNFKLMAPGTPVAQCPLKTCGHVHINVDGTKCNDTASGFPYNAAGIASPLDIGLDYCIGGVKGTHTVTISLHDTNHGAIKDSSGAAVEDSISITAAAEGDGGNVTDGGTEGGAKTDH